MTCYDSQAGLTSVSEAQAQGGLYPYGPNHSLVSNGKGLMSRVLRHQRPQHSVLILLLAALSTMLSYPTCVTYHYVVITKSLT